jgi:amino acid transporter
VPDFNHVGQLRRGVLGLSDAFAQSLALLALALGSSLATTGVAADAGAAVPLTYVIAGVGSLCLASVIIRFSKRMASAGGVYTYIARGLGPDAGFIGGWLYAIGFAAGISFVLVISSVYLSEVLEVHAHIQIGWFATFFILMAALSVISFLDVRISTRAQLVASAVGAVAILVAMVIILGKGGQNGINAQPFNPSHAHGLHNIFLGTVLAFTGFIGFESAAALGEEVADPLRHVPRAILSVTIVGLLFYVFVTWTMSLGFGVANAGAWAKDPTALDTLTTHYAGSGLAVIVDLAVVVDAFVAALAGVHLTSRTLFAMGRDGGLPRVFAWTHPRFRTPWAGIILALVTTIVLVIWLARATYDPFTYFAFMATTASLGILATYILISLGGIRFFWREQQAGGTRYNVLLDLILPVAGIAICGLTIYYSIEPVPPHPIDLAPWIALIWLLIGLAVLAFLRIRSPERVRRFGMALGEGEIADPGPEPPPADDLGVQPLV